LMFVESQRVHI